MFLTKVPVLSGGVIFVILTTVPSGWSFQIWDFPLKAAKHKVPLTLTKSLRLLVSTPSVVPANTALPAVSIFQISRPLFVVK